MAIGFESANDELAEAVLSSPSSDFLSITWNEPRHRMGSSSHRRLFEFSEALEVGDRTNQGRTAGRRTYVEVTVAGAAARQQLRSAFVATLGRIPSIIGDAVLGQLQH